MWHKPDTSPSLVAYNNIDAEYYYKPHFRCFACGMYGDLIDFVRQYLSLDFVSAINELKNIAEHVGKEFNFIFNDKKDKKKIKTSKYSKDRQYDEYGEIEDNKVNYQSLDEIRNDIKENLYNHLSDLTFNKRESNIFLVKVSSGVGKTWAMIDFIGKELMNYNVLIVSPTLETVNEIYKNLLDYKIEIRKKENTSTRIKFIDGKMFRYKENDVYEEYKLNPIKIYGLLDACKKSHKEAEIAKILTKDDYNDKDFKLYKQQENLLKSKLSGADLCKNCKLKNNCEYIKFTSKNNLGKNDNTTYANIFIATHQKSKFALDSIINKVKPRIIFFDEDITKTLIDKSEFKFYDLLQIQNKIDEFMNVIIENSPDNENLFTFIYLLKYIIDSISSIIENFNHKILYGRNLYELINNDFKNKKINRDFHDTLIFLKTEIKNSDNYDLFNTFSKYNKAFLVSLLDELAFYCKNLFIYKGNKGKNLIISRYIGLPSSLMNDNKIPIFFLDATMSTNLLSLALNKKVTSYYGTVQFKNLLIYQNFDNTFTSTSLKKNDGLFRSYVNFIKSLSDITETNVNKNKDKQILVVSPKDITKKLEKELQNKNNVQCLNYGNTTGTNNLKDKSMIVLSPNKIREQDLFTDYLTLKYKNEQKELLNIEKVKRLVPTGYFEDNKELYILEYQYDDEQLQLLYEAMKHAQMAQAIGRINRDINSDEIKKVFIFGRHSLKKFNIIPNKIHHLEKKVNNIELHLILKDLVLITNKKLGFWSVYLKKEEVEDIINELKHLYSWKEEEEAPLKGGLINIIENAPFISNTKVSKDLTNDEFNKNESKSPDKKTLNKYLDDIYTKYGLQKLELPISGIMKHKIYVTESSKEKSFKDALIYFNEYLIKTNHKNIVKDLMISI